MRLNSVYKHSFEVEKKLTAYYLEYEKSLQYYLIKLSSIIKSVFWKDEKQLSEINQLIEEINKEKEKLREHYKNIFEIIKVIQKSNGDFSLFENMDKNFDSIIGLNNKILNEIKKLNEKIIEFFRDHKEFLSRYNDIYEKFTAQYTCIDWNLFQRSLNTFAQDFYLVKSIRDGNKNHLFDRFHRSKKQTKIKIGFTKVFIEVRSEVDIAKEKVGDKTLIEILKDYINDKLFDGGVSEARRKWFKEVIKKDHIQIEDELIQMILNIIIEVLNNNPKLLRASKVNIYAKINPTSKRQGVLGSYWKSSYYSDIFLEFTLTSEILFSYAYDGTATGGSLMKIYNTIVHELTHSYDWRLNTDKEYAFTYDILGEEPAIEIIKVTALLSLLRSEGLARISGFMKTVIDSNIGVLIFSFDELTSHYIKAKKSLISLFDLNSGVQTSLNEKIKEISGDGTCHDYGEYMTLIILVYKLRKVIFFWYCGRDNMRNKVIAEIIVKNTKIVDIANKYGWKQIPKAEIGKYLSNESGLNCLIFPRDYDKVQQFMAWISLLKPQDFFKQYLEACKELGINAGPLTIENLRKLNDEKRKQYQKALHKEGF